MSRTIEAVKEFHSACYFDDPVTPTVVPTTVPSYVASLGSQLRHMSQNLAHIGAAIIGGSGATDVPLQRLQLLTEEMAELCEGIAEGNIVEILDAITDLQYLLDGTVLNFGLADVADAAFDEVHRSNMSKFADGEPDRTPSGKVIKGPSYSPPDLSTLVGAK
jgi:predicted HAD superfamily Cof-like phosphohydrolase